MPCYLAISLSGLFICYNPILCARSKNFLGELAAQGPLLSAKRNSRGVKVGIHSQQHLRKLNSLTPLF